MATQNRIIVTKWDPAQQLWVRVGGARFREDGRCDSMGRPLEPKALACAKLAGAEFARNPGAKILNFELEGEKFRMDRY